MKIIFEREPFSGAFQTAASVAPSRSPKPILQNVKLSVADGGAVLTATDLEVGVRVECPGVTVEEPGDALLPVARFGGILRESRDEKLVLQVDGTAAEVSGERSKFKLECASADEFPPVASFDGEEFIQVGSRLFKQLIHRTLFATDTDSTRYALGGVKLEVDDNELIAIGTDGRRLAKMQGPCDKAGGYEIAADASVIVPARAMSLIERTLGDGEGDVRFHAGGNDVRVQAGGITVYARLVEGRFPKWRDVFPRRADAQQIDIPVGPLLTSVRQAAVVASEESRGIIFTFRAGEVELAGSTAEIGQSNVTLPLSYDGPEIPISLDYGFVADFLKTLSPDATFTLEIENSDGAAVMTTNDNYGYVVMPLALNR
jgi:DNA polymerase-3 subunit beta